MTPDQAKTPVRTFRAGVEYDEALAIARARGENLSEHVLRPALIKYIEDAAG
jgi:hypothetical protein